jgi:quercetin dioxygenase-like cupin family protein
MQNLIHNAVDIQAFSPDKLNKVKLYESSRMFCDVYCLAPGQAQNPHEHHEEDKIYVCLTGTCEVKIGDLTQALPAGHVAVAPAGMIHGISNASDSPATVLVVMAPNPKHRAGS